MEGCIGADHLGGRRDPPYPVYTRFRRLARGADLHAGAAPISGLAASFHLARLAFQVAFRAGLLCPPTLHIATRQIPVDPATLSRFPTLDRNPRLPVQRPWTPERIREPLVRGLVGDERLAICIPLERPVEPRGDIAQVARHRRVMADLDIVVRARPARHAIQKGLELQGVQAVRCVDRNCDPSPGEAPDNSTSGPGSNPACD